MMRLSIAAMSLALAWGCGDRAQPARDDVAQTFTTATGDAARVDGVSLAVSDVAATSAALQVDAKTALERLIAEQLLIKEAERRGLQREPSVDHVSRQAAVQELLAREVESVVVDDAAIADAYAAQHERFVQPVRRASIHVLVSLAKDANRDRDEAAHQLAAKLTAELRAAPDPRAVWVRYQSVGQLQGFTIKAETLPAAGRDERYVEEYLAGLFSSPGLGPLDHPVRTSFGWHSIVVTEITPGSVVTLEQAKDTLRTELVAKARQQAFDRMESDVSARIGVVRDEAAIEAAMRAEDLLPPSAP